jgi:hypothetical protein
MAVQVAAHQSKRGLPAERSAACALRASLRRASANTPRRRLQPRVGQARGIVAAYGHERSLRRQRAHHHLRDRGRRARVSDLAEGLGGAASHDGLRVLERGQQRIHRQRLADEAEGERRHLPDLELGILEQGNEGRHRAGVADAPGGEGGAAAHAAVGVGEAELDVGGEVAPVLGGQDARQLFHPGDGRRR